MSSQNTVNETDAPENPAGVSLVNLLQIVQNLITLGLNSIELWTNVIPKVKDHKNFPKHPENQNLHLLLMQVSNHFCSKLFEFFPNDLSQEKLPQMLIQKISSNDLIKVVKPLLKKKKFTDRSFSIECSNNLNSIIEDILEKGCEKPDFSYCSEEEEQVFDQITSKPKAQISKSKVQRSSKRKRSPSPSSSSGEESCDSSQVSDLSDSEDDRHNFSKLFKSSMKGPVKIKQIFQTQKNRLRRKLTTPGEEGRYMVKVEVTDTKDLRRCNPNQYWTKVSTKAIFLTESKSSLLKNIKSMLFDVGSKIKLTSGVEYEEIKLDRKSK